MDKNKNKLVIVCVDDEKIVLDSLNYQLQHHFQDTYDFEFAESAEEAIHVIQQLNEEGIDVALIIADQIMPGMKGDEFLTLVNKMFPDPIKILLTGQASLESAIKAINNAGLYRYLCKPWNEGDFLMTIENALEKYKSEEDTQLQMYKLLRSKNE